MDLTAEEIWRKQWFYLAEARSCLQNVYYVAFLKSVYFVVFINFRVILTNLFSISLSLVLIYPRHFHACGFLCHHHLSSASCTLALSRQTFFLALIISSYSHIMAGQLFLIQRKMRTTTATSTICANMQDKIRIVIYSSVVLCILNCYGCCRPEN